MSSPIRRESSKLLSLPWQILLGRLNRFHAPGLKQRVRPSHFPPVFVLDGFSLLEVILALAILAGALAILSEVARTAMWNAGRTRDLAQAQLLCESKLAEILAGIEPAEPISGASLETGQSPEWLYSIEITPLDVEGLVEVRVTVEQDLPPEKRPVSCTLVRWMVDPSTVTEVDLVAEARLAATVSSESTGRSSATGERTASEGGEQGGGSGTASGGGQPSAPSGAAPLAGGGTPGFSAPSGPPAAPAPAPTPSQPPQSSPQEERNSSRR